MRITMDDIIVAVCRYYHLERDELLGPEHYHVINHPRQVCYSLAREFTTASHRSIAARFNRDRTTVMTGLKTHAERCRYMPTVAQDYAVLSRKFGAYKERLSYEDAYPIAWQTWAFIHRASGAEA